MELVRKYYYLNIGKGKLIDKIIDIFTPHAEDNKKRRKVQKFNCHFQECLNPVYSPQLEKVKVKIYLCGNCKSFFNSVFQIFWHCLCQSCKLNDQRSPIFIINKKSKLLATIEDILKVFEVRELYEGQNISSLYRISTNYIIKRRDGKEISQEDVSQSEKCCKHCKQQYVNVAKFINHKLNLCTQIYNQRAPLRLELVRTPEPFPVFRYQVLNLFKNYCTIMNRSSLNSLVFERHSFAVEEQNTSQLNFPLQNSKNQPDKNQKVLVQQKSSLNQNRIIQTQTSPVMSSQQIGRLRPRIRTQHHDHFSPEKQHQQQDKSNSEKTESQCKYLYPNHLFIRKTGGQKYYCGKCKVFCKRVQFFIQHIKQCQTFCQPASSHFLMTLEERRHFVRKRALNSQNCHPPKVQATHFVQKKYQLCFGDYSFFQRKNIPDFLKTHDFRISQPASHILLKFRMQNKGWPKYISFPVEASPQEEEQQYYCPCNVHRNMKRKQFVQHVSIKHQGITPPFTMDKN